MENIPIEYEKLIYKVASQFYNADKEDLYQVGVMGLLKAQKNFEPNGDTKFTTYAYEYIFGEMYKLVNESRSIKLNRNILRLYKRIEQTKYKLAQRMGKIPSNEEIAIFLELEPSLVEECIIASKNILSMDKVTSEESDLYDCIPENNSLDIDREVDIRDSMENLSSDEKKIIDYRYYQDLTQSETAKRLGMTQVMVSRYEKKGLNKMRSYLLN